MVLLNFVITIIGIVLIENYDFNDAKLIFAFVDFAIVRLNINIDIIDYILSLVKWEWIYIV